MTLQGQMLFWSAALVVLIALLWLLSPILLPFVAGFGIAYLLRPVVDWLERMRVNRMIAALLAVTLVVLAFTVIVLAVVPVFASQLTSFIQKVPEYVGKLQVLLNDPQHPWLQKIVGLTGGDNAVGVSDLVKEGTGWITAFLAGLWSGGQSLISLFSLLVVAPVVAFYFLYDWNRMIATMDGWVPVPHRPTVRDLARKVDAAIAGFVRGQTAVCLLLGAFYAIGLSLAGLNFGLLIGLVAGLLTFIPYVGSLTGLVVSTGVAVAQFWPEWVPIATVVGVFFVGQFIEGNILSPKLVGESIGVHPVWLIFALLAFGYLFGFVGLLLGAPLAATAGVLVRFAMHRYRASVLFTGDPPSLPPPDRMIS
ncbi:MAG: AI-2E family transporter [Proteobacteria bacterium]|nr:AI-2E family transporter [Pseudomonadota bacterium]